MNPPKRMLVVAMANRIEGLRVAVGLTMADAPLQVAVWGELHDDEAATPQLEALAFGDIEDPGSNVSQLVAENRHFRMHEELGTGPNFYYLWDRADGGDEGEGKS